MGAAPPGGLQIPHGQQQSQIVLLAPHQNGTKQGRKCNHSTWSLDDLLVALSWVYPARLASPIFSEAFRTGGQNYNVPGISRFGEVVRHSALCEFLGCALCHEVSHRERRRGDIDPLSFQMGVEGRRRCVLITVL